MVYQLSLGRSSVLFSPLQLLAANQCDFRIDIELRLELRIETSTVDTDFFSSISGCGSVLATTMKNVHLTALACWKTSLIMMANELNKYLVPVLAGTRLINMPGYLGETGSCK